MSARRSLLLVSALLLVFAVSAQADEMSPMGGAEFVVGSDITYIYGTTESADNEEAIIPLYYNVYGEGLPEGDVITISLKISYDKTKLELFDASSTYWPGDVTVDSNSAAPNVIIFLDAGSMPKEFTQVEFATLKFRAKCQDGITPSGIGVVEGLNNSYVLVGPTAQQVYDDLDGGDGEVSIDTYTGYVSIIDPDPTDPEAVQMTLQGDVGIDTTITVPVYMTSNFNVMGTYFPVNFDETKLEAIDAVLYGGMEWMFGSPIIGTNYVFFWCGAIQPIPPQSTPFLLAEITFRVINNWEGQSTSITFNEQMYTYPLEVGFRWGGECPTIWNATDVPCYDGIIEMENYAAALKTVVGDMIWPADITAGQAEFPVTIQMKNNFIAGGGIVGETSDVDAQIMINFTFTENQTAQVTDIFRTTVHDPENPLTDFWFDFDVDPAKGIAYNVEFFTVPQSGLPNQREICSTFTDLLNFELEYDVVAPTSFDARFLPITYLCTFDGLQTRVMDAPTGDITTSCGNYLTFEPGSQAEYAVGEFYAPGVTVNGQTNPVYQHYYIRHNQDHVNFRIKIRESGPHSMNQITPAYGVEIYQQGSDYVILQSNANWDTTAVLTRKEIAVIKYTSFTYPDPEPFKGDGGITGDPNKDSGPPIEYCYTTTNIYLENPLIEDALDRQPTYFTIAGPVRNKYICGIYQPRGLDDIEPWKGDNTPTEFALYANRPNPFNPTTSIAFDMPVSGHVNIEVFNILGQKVATLVDEVREAGHHEVIWNANGFGSGVFLYRMTADGYQKTQKMLLMK